MQIRGGRGYETAASLKARGEAPVPVERFLRDSRINTIFEGSSEIMRLFIAREMLDAHLKVSAAVLNSQLPWRQRLRAAAKAALFYSVWYPRQWLPFAEWIKVQDAGFNTRCATAARLRTHLRYAARTSRRLARSLFHALLRHGPKLEREQLLLGRFVDIGTELFAITATCLRAERRLNAGDTHLEKQPLLELVDFFCQSARLRIEEKFHRLHVNEDRASYQTSRQVLAGEMAELGKGIVSRKN